MEFETRYHYEDETGEYYYYKKGKQWLACYRDLSAFYSNTNILASEGEAINWLNQIWEERISGLPPRI